MESVRKILIIPASIILFVGILAAGYFFYIKSDQKGINIIKAVPEDAAIIISTDHVTHLWQALSETEQWHGLLNIEPLLKLHSNLHYIDSITQTNEKVRNILDNNRFVFSVCNNNGRPESIILIALDNMRQKKFVINYIKETSKIRLLETLEFNNKNIYRIRTKNNDKSLYFSVIKDLFICSWDIGLLKLSIEQLLSGSSLDTNPEFQEVIVTAGKKVDANVYINNPSLRSILSTFTDSSYRNILLNMNDLAGWSVLDLNIKDREILLNGYTSLHKDHNNFLHLFNNQGLAGNQVVNILPFNTTFFTTLGFDDPEKYFKEYKIFIDNQNLSSEDETLDLQTSGKMSADLNAEIPAWLGKKITLAVVEPQDSNIKNYTFMIFETKDPESCRRWINSSAQTELTQTHYQKEIFELNGDLSLRILFGPFMDHYDPQYLTFIEDFLIISADLQNLKKLIHYYSTGRTLFKNDHYQEFSDNIAESSNVYLYLNLRRSGKLFESIIRSDLKDDIASGFHKLKFFEGPAIQFSGVRDLFYTNLYLRYHPEISEEDVYLWQTALDTAINKGPFMVKNHQTGKLNVVVFDMNNTMYMINHEGEIIWTRSLGDTIISELYQIDLYRNNKIQYLFNSPEKLYLVDLNGNDVAGYPVKLESRATNGLTVFDYANTKNYRLFIASENNRVYNYTKVGKRIIGWNSPKLPGPVTSKLQRLVINNKDYIIMPLNNGNVYMTDRKGNVRLTIKKSFVNSTNSNFYRNRTNSKGMMITTDIEGNIVYIPRKGSVQATAFGEFSSNPHFLYEDFDGDGSRDFIFLDQNELVVYNRFKEPILQYRFEQPVDGIPQVISIPGEDLLIGFADKNNKHTWLFNKLGLLDWSTKLNGDTPIEIGSLNNDSELNLVVGAGNVVYNYLFE